jgi:signal transduction histidine kinase
LNPTNHTYSKNISGVLNTIDLNTARQNIKRISWLAILFMLINGIINYVLDYTISLTIIASTIPLLIINVLVVFPRNILLARYLFLIVMLTCIVLLSISEGLVSGNYLYLFLFLIIANFIFNYREKVHIAATCALLLLGLILIMLLSPKHSTLQQMDSNSENTNFALNMFASFFFGSVLVFRLLKINFSKLTIIEEQSQLLHTVYHSSLDAVFIIELPGNQITDCNENSLKLFSLQDSGVVKGEHMSVLFVPPYNNPLLSPGLYLPYDAWQGEADCITRDGIIFPGYISVVPFANKGVQFKKISILDISQIRKVQDQLIEARNKAEEATNVKSRFLSNMSHELRTPLNGIIGTANLLLEEKNLPENLENHFTLLKYSSEHMLELVNNVLDFSKIEADKMELTNETFNLENLIHRLYYMFCPQYDTKKIDFSYKVDPELNRSFTGDSLRIGQVLSNILANACKFTSKGFVNITVKQVSQQDTFTTVYFEVSDTGIGIPEDKHLLIFESFGQADTATTRKFGGTGLGLAISKRIVEAYGGNLQVKNNSSGGSTFYFTLQLNHCNQKPPPQQQSPNNMTSLKGLRLLIAEDNPVNMMIAVRFMEKWDINPVEANNGVKALAFFEQHEFDVILADLEMPEMDGYQLLESVKRTNSNIPIIAFTAAIYENMQEDLKQKGFTDYLQKPFNPAELHHKLMQHYIKVN